MYKKIIAAIGALVIAGGIGTGTYITQKPEKAVKVLGSEKTMQLPSGQYTGDVLLNSISGDGTFEFASGEVYTGSWVKNEMNGKGTMTYSDGVYEGDFVNSQRCGSGTYKWNGGSVYEGTWENDKLSGSGKLTCVDGRVYEGTFQDNCFEEGTIVSQQPEGVYTFNVTGGNTKNVDIAFANGNKYTGEFSDGSLNGQGKMTFSGIGVYDGSFLNGKRNGYGKFVWNDGDVYEGNWDNDNMSGQGTYKFGGKYVSGVFTANTLNGKYTYHDSTGNYETFWENGVCTYIEKKQ